MSASCSESTDQPCACGYAPDTEVLVSNRASPTVTPMELSQFQGQQQQMNPAIKTSYVNPSNYVLHLENFISPDSQYLVTQKGEYIYMSERNTSVLPFIMPASLSDPSHALHPA